MSKSFLEKLKEIINDSCGYTGHHKSGCSVCDDIIKSILSIILYEIVPEEAVREMPPIVAGGWNACRSEILKRIGEI